MKKKILMAVLMVGLVASVTACGNKNETAETELESENSVQEEVVEETQEPAEEEVTEPATEQEATEETDMEETVETVIPELNIPEVDVPDTEAMAFVEDMKMGWNLGNTLDASNDGFSGDELNTETCWGNPKTTKEMIDAIKAAGFNTLRLPVTWHGHITVEPTTESHLGAGITVSEVWMDRVQEVVDYACDNEMYVILNIHHDTNLEYYYPDSEHYDQSANFMCAVWTAISERFKDYDDHLIFESINEPRLVGTNVEWNFQSYDQACQDSEDCINRLNQLFVDTVRASGGNNAQRYLMVPGYSASLAGVETDLFVLPQDTAENKMIVSVHAYTPYDFALNPSGYDQFSADNLANTRDIEYLMTKLFDKFISNGVPVVIGEYGAVDRNGNLQSRVDYHAYFVAAARARGVTCCVWDNGLIKEGNEIFGLLDRNKLEWAFPDLIAAMMQYA